MYTYLLYHIHTEKYYYGSKYSIKDSNPKNFWKTYFTSSKIVKALRDEYGDDSFKYWIHKTFETLMETN